MYIQHNIQVQKRWLLHYATFCYLIINIVDIIILLLFYLYKRELYIYCHNELMGKSNACQKYFLKQILNECVHIWKVAWKNIKKNLELSLKSLSYTFIQVFSWYCYFIWKSHSSRHGTDEGTKYKATVLHHWLWKIVARFYE